MEHKGLMTTIEILIERELASAKNRFKSFNSAHEGYAVILEEFQELQEEMEKFQCHLQQLWCGVRANDLALQRKQAEIMSKTISELLKEGVQLGAMCERFLEDLGN